MAAVELGCVPAVVGGFPAGSAVGVAHPAREIAGGLFDQQFHSLGPGPGVPEVAEGLGYVTFLLQRDEKQIPAGQVQQVLKILVINFGLDQDVAGSQELQPGDQMPGHRCGTIRWCGQPQVNETQHFIQRISGRKVLVIPAGGSGQGQIRLEEILGAQARLQIRTAVQGIT